MATFITSKSVGQQINVYVETSNGFWKYNHNGSDSSVFANGWTNNIPVTNANGEFTLISCDNNGNVNGYLTVIDLNFSDITSFDGTGLSGLTSLELGGNQLTSLDTSGLSNLTFLSLYVNQLTSFDGTGLSGLTTLFLDANPITSFNTTDLGGLTHLYLNGTQLTSYDIFADFPNLTVLALNSNNITSFNTANLSTNLTTLVLNTNQLTSLDVSGLSNLTTLGLNNNWSMTPSANDQILQQLNQHGVSNGYFTSVNGRTAASNTYFNNLLNNLTWTLSGLDLVSGPVVGNGKLAIRGVNSGGGTTTTTTTEAPTTTTTTTETPVTTTTTTQGPTNYTFNPSLSPNYSSFTFTVETTPPQKDGGIIDIVNLFITVKESSTIFQPYVKLYYVTASDIANNNLGIYADGGQFVGTSTPGVMKTGNFYFNTTDPKGLPLNGTTPVSGLTFRVRISELADTDTVLEEFLYTV